MTKCDDCLRCCGAKMDYALESIVWYNGHEEWLEDLAKKLEKTDAREVFSCPFDVVDWHTEQHTIWMLLVGMFGDWGTSIRSGWIDKPQEAAEYIHRLCRKEE